jgi:hypothetical protein
MLTKSKAAHYSILALNLQLPLGTGLETRGPIVLSSPLAQKPVTSAVPTCEMQARKPS